MKTVVYAYLAIHVDSTNQKVNYDNDSLNILEKYSRVL